MQVKSEYLKFFFIQFEGEIVVQKKKTTESEVKEK